jgi:phytoene synthase
MMPIRFAPGDIEASARFCRCYTRRHARSFYFSSLALPRPKRDAAYAVYSFCRYADDIVDESRDATDAALARISADFDRMAAGELREPAFAPAFACAVQKYRIEKQPFMELIEGVARDQQRVRIRDWSELCDYCYHVASTVGLMMASILELRDQAGRKKAIELGIAMQLTNIARDVREDFERDRIYLPADELALFGVSESDLATGRVTKRFKRLMRFQIKRARQFFSSAESGIPLLRDDGSQYTVWLMRHVYAGILTEIEQADYDVFRKRAATSFLKKISLARRAWIDYRRTRA